MSSLNLSAWRSYLFQIVSLCLRGLRDLMPGQNQNSFGQRLSGRFPSLHSVAYDFVISSATYPISERNSRELSQTYLHTGGNMFPYVPKLEPLSSHTKTSE
jgi:hypothetical protein